jgi:hypothetical protein
MGIEEIDRTRHGSQIVITRGADGYNSIPYANRMPKLVVSLPILRQELQQLIPTRCVKDIRRPGERAQIIITPRAPNNHPLLKTKRDAKAIIGLCVARDEYPPERSTPKLKEHDGSRSRSGNRVAMNTNSDFSIVNGNGRAESVKTLWYRSVDLRVLELIVFATSRMC